MKGNKNKPNIMIGCPLSTGRSYVLNDYLNHIHELEYPKGNIHIAFLFNYPHSKGEVAVPHTTINQQPTSNREDEVKKIRNILRNFKNKTKKEYRKISIHEYEGNYEDRHIQGRRALGRWMDYFAAIRNKWIQMRTPTDDYLFSVDSDILVPRDSLKRLLEHNVDIISLLLANGPIQDPYISPNRLDNFLLPFTITYHGVNPEFIDRVYLNGRMAFNIMNKYADNGVGRNRYDTMNYRHVDPAELHVREIQNYDKEFYHQNLKGRLDLGPWTVPQRYGPLVEVDMTGAAYLIKREVLDKGVEYGYAHQGEDCYFCAMAQEKGFKIYCDYNIRANHIMNEEIWRGWQASKRMRVVGFKPPKGEKQPKPKIDDLDSTVPVILNKVKAY